MDTNNFEFLDQSNPSNPQRLFMLGGSGDISSIECNILKGTGGSADKYIILFHTKSNIAGKKSNCLMMEFNSLEEREVFIKELSSILKPVTFEGSWRII